MNFKTKFLNIFRHICKISIIESKLADNIIAGNKLSKKLIASNQMYSKGSIRNCKRNDINFQLDISDYMEHAIYFGINDTIDFDRTMLYSVIKEDFICFDVGANIGETSLNFARIASNGLVYSFEPVPFLFNRLKKNIKLNSFSNIKIYNLAVSEIKQELYFELPDNQNSSGISLNKNKSTHSSIVYSTTIDSFVLEHSISNIDFIKIDVEGFENFVLNGASNTLQTMHPILFIEIDNKNLTKNGSSEKKLLDQLRNEFNYTLFKVDGNNKIKIEEINNTIEHYDVLCVKI